MRQFYPSVLFLFFLSVLLPKQGWTQQWLTTQHIAKNSNDSFKDISTDSLGNIYVAGYISNWYNAENIVLGGKSVFVAGGYIAKLDTNQKLLWFSNDFGDNGMPHAITSDKAGNVYVTGQESSYSVTVRKYSRDGKRIWNKTDGSQSSYTGQSIAVDEQGNIYVAGTVSSYGVKIFRKNLSGGSSCCPDHDFSAKFDSNGDILWAQTSAGDQNGAKSLVLDSKGNTITAGYFTEQATFGAVTFQSYTRIGGGFIVKRAPDGKVLWAKAAMGRGGEYAQSLVRDENDYLYLSGIFQDSIRIGEATLTSPGSQNSYLAKLDSYGNVQWLKQLNKFGKNSVPFIADISLGKNSLLVTGSYTGTVSFGDDTLTSGKRNDRNAFVARFDLEGNPIWGIGTEGEANESISALTSVDNKGVFYVVGDFMNGPCSINGIKYENKGGQDSFFASVLDYVSIDSTLTNQIKGTVFQSDNADCPTQQGQKGLANLIVVAQPGPYYGISDSAGKYTIRTDTGKYEVTQILPQRTGWTITQTCPPPNASSKVHFTARNQTVGQINFSNRVVKYPFLKVDVAADRRRRCFRGGTTIRYCNEGSAEATNVQVTVTYPEYVVPIQANVSWTRKNGQLLFNIGTLAPGACGTISIVDSVACGNESIRGLTQCVKVAITPGNRTKLPDTRWDGSDVALEARCKDNGFVKLTIRNTGSGHMADSAAYRIFLDAEVVFEHKYQLKSGDSLQLEVPVNGKTIRLEADLRPYHPDQGRTPSVSLEGCGGATQATVSKGYVTQLPPDDALAEMAEVCLPIRDSFDPNDKQVSPMGAGVDHLIRPGQPLDYLIRFQNTGNDMAYIVTVQDTLDENLDIASLEMGTASHPFTWSLSGKSRPVITWTFRNINMPDSNTNEAQSHGFLHFRIGQKVGTPLATRISNQAAILFDFNSPVLTNRTSHTLGELIVNGSQSIPVDVCSGNYPTQAQAGDTIRLQTVGKTTLNANSPQKGHGQWRLIAGAGTFADLNDPRTDITELAAGINILEWRITLCDSTSRSRLVVERMIPPPGVAHPEVAICSGEQPSLGISGEKLTWYADEQLTQKLGQDTRFYPTISGIYYVTQTVDGYESAPTPLLVRVNPRPVAPAVEAADRLYCEGDVKESLHASGEHIRWYADAALQQLKGTGPAYQPTNTATDTLYATQTVEACESPAVPVVVRVQPSKVEFRIEGDTLIAPQADAYQWYFNGQPLAKGTAQRYLAINSGSYSLVVKLETCLVSSDPVNHTVQVNGHRLRLSPNPSPDWVQLTFVSAQNGPVEIRVYNAIGKRVYQQVLTKSLTVLEHSLDLSLLPNGIYILEMLAEEGVITGKLIHK